MNPPRLLRLAPVYAAVLVSAACTDMTGPTDGPPPMLIEIGAAATLSVAAQDVIDRVLGGLDESTERNAIDVAVRSLSAALVSREPAEVTKAADAFRVSFERYASIQQQGWLNPDFETVRLLLDETQIMASNFTLVPKTTR